MEINKWKILFLLIVIFYVMGIISYLIFSLINFYFKKRKSYFSGFVIFNIDTKKQRVRLNNDIKPLSYLPFFLKKSSILNGEWFNMNSFISIFDDKTKKALGNVFFKNQNIESRLFFNLQLKNDDDNKYKLILEQNETDLFQATIYWLKNEYDYIEPEIVFDKINSRNDELSFINHSSSIILNIKKQCLYNKDYILQEIVKRIEQKWHKKLNLLIYNSTFFISFSSDDKDNKEINKYFKYINTLSERLNCLRKYLNLNIVSDSSFIKKLDTQNFNLYLNFLIINNKNIKEILKSQLLTFENINQCKPFEKFSETYLEAIALINKQAFLLEKIKINNVHTNELSKKNLLNLKFSNLNKENKYRKNLINTDAFDYLWLMFFKNIKHYNVNNSIIYINDYLLNFLNINYLSVLNKEFQNLTFVININNFDNLNYIKEKMIELSNVKCNLGIKINSIEIEKVMDFNKEINLQYIIINKLICMNLSNLKNYLFISTFLDKIKTENMHIIFEYLDVENYKKLINNKIDKIYYTSNN